MYITIDEKKADFTVDDVNIVEVADKAGIGIPAPCYRTNRKNGCCKACVIEIEGKQAYACCTKPVEGMNVTVNRDDLISIRKERIKAYMKNPGQECNSSCDCSTLTTSGGSCC